MAKSIRIFYVSGTGNTRIVTNLVREALENKGANIDIVNIEEMLKRDI